MAYKFFILLGVVCLINVSCDITKNVEPDQDDVFLKLFGGVKADEAHDFLQTDDGGFVIVGRTTSFSESNYDILLIKTDENGNELWKKSLGDEFDNSANSIIYANDNNGFVICGATANSTGVRDVLLKKIDLEGNEVASESFGLPTNDEYGEEVIQAPSGGYYVIGNIDNTKRLYLFETDENFVIKGSGSYSRYNRASAEGSPFEQVKSAIPHDNEFYLLLGTTEDGNNSTVFDGTKNIVTFLQRFSGDPFEGQVYFGDVGGVGDDYASDMIKVSGGYIIVGYKINENNIRIPYVIKVRDNYPDKVWEYTYSDMEVLTGSNEPVSVIETNDGGYTLLMTSTVSQFGNQIGLMKLDVNGNKIWERHLGSQNNDYAGSLVQLGNDFYVACGSFSLGESNGQNLLKAGLIKTNPNGELKPMGK